MDQPQESFRSKSLIKIADKQIFALEDKHLSFLKSFRQELLQQLGTFEKVAPLAFCKSYQKRYPRWEKIRKVEQQILTIKDRRTQRKFWHKRSLIKNQLQTKRHDDVNSFYHSLINSARRYNTRLDLFDYTLDRQQKKLDPPYTVGELEKIETTIQRIFNAINSAIKLLEIAEHHQELDLADLVRNQFHASDWSAEYISDAVELDSSGQFIQDLLVIENDLRTELMDISKNYSQDDE